MSAMRVLFLVMAAIILLGIGLSGFRQVHWLLYFPVVALTFAGISGICPGLIILKKLGLKGGSLNRDQ
ncbi:MAG: DUF2892 domain-containing protein [Gammaproteobacteria bacterium]|nr:DUF2892 domain-containing protein [Gammaproteobacteria bacterium]